MKAGKREKSAGSAETGRERSAHIQQLLRAPVACLTEREIGVLGLRAKGLVYKEIADRLGISAHTVKNHLESIHHKLGAHNTVEAINAAKAARVPLD